MEEEIQKKQKKNSVNKKCVTHGNRIKISSKIALKYLYMDAEHGWYERRWVSSSFEVRAAPGTQPNS